MQVPHLIFLLVDDLGHANVGFHRTETTPPAEVQTPNIDSLARSGTILERHYVYRLCTPSRSSFLSGRFPVHVTEKLLNPEKPDAGIPRNMTTIGTVMQRAGYFTAQVGKWDAGMATPTHTPRGRGFNTSLGYFGHKNDYWTKGIMQSDCLGHGEPYGTLKDLWDGDGPASIVEGEFEEHTFRERALKIVQTHRMRLEAESAVGAPHTPLFLLYTPHVAHCPLQVPQPYIDRFEPLTAHNDEGECVAQTNPHFCPMCTGPTPSWPANKTYPCRALYAAMVSFLDETVGLLMGELSVAQGDGRGGGHGGGESRSMLEDSLIVFSSDNGGPIKLDESAASNFPLRGGKYSDLEGGVRAAAFVAGGAVPKAFRGTRSQVVMHIADWYATFAFLAGLPYPTDEAAAASGLPPLDSANAWPALFSDPSTGTDMAARFTHAELPLSSRALLDARSGLKLLFGSQHSSGWQGPSYPNASSALHDPSKALLDCTRGCLYNVTADPTELHDLAATMPGAVEAMAHRLAVLSRRFFNNSDVGVDSCPPNVLPPGLPCACWVADRRYGGVLGPYQEVLVPTSLARSNPTVP